METYEYRMVKTHTGSIYEVRCVDGVWQTRRQEDERDPTPRVGRNGHGEWADLAVEPQIEVGQPIMFIWPDDVPLLEGSPAGAVRSTITSPVVSVVVC